MDKAGRQQRYVETFAVERDQGLAGGDEFFQGRQLGRLLGWIAHEELGQTELVPIEAADPDQKGVSAGAARQAGGLGVQISEGLGRHFSQARRVGPAADGVQGRGGGNRPLPQIIARRVARFHHEGLSLGGLQRLAFQNLFDGEGIFRPRRGQVVATDLNAQGLELVR